MGTKLISLSSSALVDEIGVERGPASFSDRYGWQVNNKHVVTDFISQERQNDPERMGRWGLVLNTTIMWFFDNCSFFYS